MKFYPKSYKLKVFYNKNDQILDVYNIKLKD